MSLFVFVQFILIWINFSTDRIVCETGDLDKSLTWIKANEKCHLARPQFEKTRGNLEVQRPVNVLNNSWVGYFKATTAFEYMACIPHVSFRNTLLFTSKVTVGHCYQACNWRNIFGIKAESCLCVTESEYDESLQYARSIDCVSIYRVNGQVAKDLNEDIYDNMCLMLQESESYKWTSCTQHAKLFCYNDNATQISSSYSWEICSKKCFNRSSHALTYTDLKAINKTFENSVWTGITSSDVIFDYKEYDGTLPNIRFGFLEKKGEKILLKFQNNDIQRKALCPKDLDMPTEYYTTPLETVTYHDITSAHVSPKDFHTQTQNKQNGNNNDGDSGVFVISGASIGSAFVVIIAAVVVGVIIKDRRSSKPKPKMSGNEHDVIFSNTNSSGVTKDVTHSESIDDFYGVTCYSQTYSVADRQVTECVSDDVSYSTTKENKTFGKNTSENIYNRLEVDGTYDTTDIVNIANNTESNNTYSHLNENADTTYNIAAIEKGTGFESGNIYNKI